MQAILSPCRLHYVLVVAEYVTVMLSLHASDDCLLLNVLQHESGGTVCASLP